MYEAHSTNKDCFKNTQLVPLTQVTFVQASVYP